jgi:hypothetical protein
MLGKQPEFRAGADSHGWQKSGDEYGRNDCARK